LLQNSAVPALRIGETVRVAVQALAIPHRTSGFQTVTVSVGAALATPSDAQRPADLIEAADATSKKPKRLASLAAQGVDPSRSFVA